MEITRNLDLTFKLDINGDIEVTVKEPNSRQGLENGRCGLPYLTAVLK